MKPLVFLFVRSTINGFKRAVTSARRLVSLVLVFGYYILVFIRPFDHSSDFKVPKTPVTNFPPAATLGPWVFLAFLILTALLSLGVFGSKGGFRPADVDVLFPTPVSSKVVLLYRLGRDYLLTLLFPLFFAIIGWRGTNAGFQTLFSNYPVYGNYILRTMVVTWLLLALVWTAIGYAASLFVNRSDVVSKRNQIIISAFAFGPAVIFIAYLSISLRLDFSLNTFNSVVNSPLSRIIFPTATAASAMAMSPLTGDFIGGGLGLLALVALGAGAIYVALSQSDWMYDQAAARSVDSSDMKTMQKKGDVMAIYALRARQGKFRKGRVSQKIASIQVKGPVGIIWKELILLSRTAAWNYVFVIIMVLFSAGSMFFAFSKAHVSEQVIGGTTFAALAFFVFMMSQIISQQGFIELLRRVDVTKSLPFSSQVSVFYEILAKTIPTSLLTIVISVGAIVYRLSLWDDALAAILTLPLFGVMLMTVSLAVTMLFPDVDDPTQRGLRGIMQLLGIVMATAVPAGLIVAGYIFKLSPLIAVIPAVIVMAAISFGCTILSGSMYASYSPTE